MTDLPSTLDRLVRCRADQYPTDSPCWISLADAAHAIAEGEFEEARKHGELDEGDVLARVDKWIDRARRRALAGEGRR